jgi:hypothetical protein
MSLNHDAGQILSLPTVSTRLTRNSALAGFVRTDPHAYNIPIRALRVRVAELPRSPKWHLLSQHF